MSGGFKALVVDDSVIYRKNIAKIVGALPDIAEVRQASNGKEAVKVIRDYPADLVTLDVEMPLMNGIEALQEILKIHPEAKVIMISSITKRGAMTTIEALSKGALDFITKEQAFGLRDEEKETLHGILLDKIRGILKLSPAGEKRAAAATKKISKAAPAILPKKKPPVPAGLAGKRPIPAQIELVLIGVSTGGPTTLQEVFKVAKDKRNYAIVIVQHMPPIFTAQLASNLSKVCNIEIKEAEEGHVLKPGDIVIAPGGKHLELKKSQLKWICCITDGEPVNFCKPSVDVTFRSVENQMRHREVIAMMLTGMGEDGAKACGALAKHGIPIITQEKDSCTVYGMPKAVDEQGITTLSAAPSFILNEAEKFMLMPRGT